MEYVTVKDVEVPALGFGTARMDTDEERYRAVSTALEVGYRHVDTAQMYGSESAVGDALADSDVDREDVFVTTKLDNGNRSRERVRESTRASLDRLGTEYVDLLLIHSPNDRVSHEETLNAMNDLRDDGLVRHVGVSNFSVEQTREAEDLSEAPILTNQVEYHVRHRQDDLLAYCVENDVMLTAYSPLGVGGLLDDEALADVGERHGKTPAQVALRWLLQQPMVSAIPMSSRPEHVRENFDVFDFELSADEMHRLFERRGGLVDRLADALGL
ncbi:aldo/keto reductase [Halomicrobium urmianum]|uniref:aldo/keto reductase n=1 Tax=Halomicrobium urmianum TaxID=1586233 RepID=UPI001CD98145|nr:aldo/keto reductase [Halomicrobium urmianum]